MILVAEKSGNSTLAKQRLHLIANIVYIMTVFTVMILLLLGIWAAISFNASSSNALSQYGAAAHKHPFVNRFIVTSTAESSLRKLGLRQGRLIALNTCQAKNHASLAKLVECAQIDDANEITVIVKTSRGMKSFAVEKADKPQKYSRGLLFWVLDSLLLTLSLVLSLLLFVKCRRFLSAYLLSFSLLLNAGESFFFYLGSNIVDTTNIESIRLSLAMVAGPMSMFFFPQAYKRNAWKTAQFITLVICIVSMLASYHFFSWPTFLSAVSFSLLLMIAHFVFKYRRILNIKERKQVLTMVFCLTVGLVLYTPLIIYGGIYGQTIGRYIIILCVGIGIFFALMRYGLWQVDSLISKSATLSVLSIIAFSAWAGLDQGMQVLLNQTIGLSNSTVTAFLAAAISSLFAVPAYNYVSKSCDAFFNKDLHQLKRLLAKEIMVLAEVQKLSEFIQQLDTKLLKLSGAQKIRLTFTDYNRRSEPHTFQAENSYEPEPNPVIRKEHFDYQIEQVLSVDLDLEYADRKINHDIKRELQEGMDEIARALASCSRWNHLEAIDVNNLA
jgi:hypothetical protein